MATKGYISSATDLFTEPGYDITVNSTSTVQYHPTATLTNTSPIQFFIQGNDTQYLDMTKTKLKLRFKVVTSTGAALAAVTAAATLNYAPVNYLMASAFDRLEVHLNETEITPKSSLYPYQGLLETMLSYSSEYKKSQAEAGGFYRVKDEALQTDAGWQSRLKMCEASKEFELIARPHGEIFSQNRFLPPGVDIRITFHRSSDAFALECHGTAKDDIKLNILEAKLYVEKVNLMPYVQLALLKNWRDHPCVYPGKRVSMKSYSLPTGTFQHTNESLLNGLVPDRIIMGLVATENVQGDYTKNPYNFEIHDLSQIIVTCNSEQQTQHIINIDKDSNRVLEGFISLFDSMGATNCDPSIDLRLNEFTNGKALYGINLRNVEDGFAIPRHGNVSIYLKFKKALTKSLTVILYPEYPSVMYISKDKQVTFKDHAQEYNK